MSKHKIVALYWKYQYWAHKTSWSAFTKSASGHGALMLYKNGDHILQGYPFDEFFLAKLLEFLFKEDNTLKSNLSNIKVSEDEEDDDGPKDKITSAIRNYVDDLSEIDERFTGFRLDLYITWITTETGQGRVPLDPYLIEQKKQGKHLKGAIRISSDEYEHIEDALCDFIDYNTFWDDTKKTLCYAEKKEGIKPWCEIPAISYGNNLPGLDYNKIIAWWVALANKKDFKYTITNNNCCKAVYTALVTGGADEFYKDRSIRIAWNPTSLYEYATNLSKAIYNAQIKKLKLNTLSRSRDHWNQVAVLTKESPFITKKEFQQKSALGRFAHRYSQLTKIDKCLDKIHRLITQQNWHVSERIVPEVIHDLLEIKLMIAEIFYKRPKTKRFSSLFELLMHVNIFLERFKITENAHDFNRIGLYKTHRSQENIKKIIDAYLENFNQGKPDENAVINHF